VNVDNTATISTLNIDPSKGGQFELQLPMSHVTKSIQCAYYEDGCWQIGGMSETYNKHCTSTHMSTFAILDVEAPITHKNNPITKMAPEDTKSTISVLTNFFIYILLLLDICLGVTLVISSYNSSKSNTISKFLISIIPNHLSIAAISKVKVLTHKKKDIGYTKTENIDADQEKSKQGKKKNLDESGNPMKTDIVNHYDRKKKIAPKKEENEFTDLKKIGKEEEFDYQIEGDNEEIQNKSFKGLYMITLPMRHKLLSPFWIDHPSLTKFARCLILVSILSSCWFIPTVMIDSASLPLTIFITFVGGFVIARLLNVALEGMFDKKHPKSVSLGSQVMMTTTLLIVQILLIITSSKLTSSQFFDLQVICFLITALELILYECVIHVIQVYLCIALRDEYTHLKGKGAYFKFFLNPIVYDYIMG
jgi:hypothetical protein